MNIYTKITRRSFLCILAGLSAVGLTRPARALTKLCASSSPDRLVPKLANFFIHKESASSVGIEYLKCVPKEADVHTLVHLIFSTKSELRTELNKADTNKFRKLLLLQQRQDFEHGRTVKVQGWILSETEARLCALAALT